jgi:hypothetical protein
MKHLKNQLQEASAQPKEDKQLAKEAVQVSNKSTRILDLR